MLIFVPHERLSLPDAAVFDFDGTLSKLRAGWESVMEPLMCELIPGEKDEVTALVKRYIDESTGIQTIFQMRWLADEIARRGGKPEDAWSYKEEYNRRLMIEVGRRRDAVKNGSEDAAFYTVPGAKEFLQTLAERGVKLFAASGTDEEDVREEARTLGFADYFAEIAGAGRSNDRCSKEAVLRRLVKPGAKLLVVGDGKVEIALGRDAGALTLGAATVDAPGDRSHAMNEAKLNRLKAAGAHAVTADFTEAEELLKWI